MMTLRFLQVTPSAQPDFPFRPNQLIHVKTLTAEMRAWIKHGYAEIVRSADRETAVAPVREKAVRR